jgi:hypothetical protein
MLRLYKVSVVNEIIRKYIFLLVIVTALNAGVELIPEA